MGVDVIGYAKMAANKRVVYVGGLAEEVDEKVLQVNKGYNEILKIQVIKNCVYKI